MHILGQAYRSTSRLWDLANMQLLQKGTLNSCIPQVMRILCGAYLLGLTTSNLKAQGSLYIRLSVDDSVHYSRPKTPTARPVLLVHFLMKGPVMQGEIYDHYSQPQKCRMAHKAKPPLPRLLSYDPVDAVLVERGIFGTQLHPLHARTSMWTRCGTEIRGL